MAACSQSAGGHNVTIGMSKAAFLVELNTGIDYDTPAQQLPATVLLRLLLLLCSCCSAAAAASATTKPPTCAPLWLVRHT
jgi:hypothetical protein